MWLASFLCYFALWYLFHALGITMGYHRLISHRSYKCPALLEFLIVSGGYLCFEGSPIKWVSAHRLHHRYSDKPGDPHSPRDGYFHAFIGWMFEDGSWNGEEQSRAICPDMWRSWVYRFLNAGHSRWHAGLCLFFCVLFRVVILVLLGPVALCANLLASVIAFCAPLLVNTVCHTKGIGYQNFDARDGSRNVWWVGLLAMGEGWHNNHHALPQSARHGLRPDEFDLSWTVISCLQKIGLAKDVRLPKVAVTEWTDGQDSDLIGEVSIQESPETLVV